MEFSQLRYFQAVARLEHFTKASEELHITQPSLSKSIANLESELGIKLFDRDTGGVRLNCYGQNFLRNVDQILTLLEDSRQQIADLAQGETGEITFAATIPGMLSPFLEEYLLTHPSVHMHQLQATAYEMKKLLENHQVDFCLSIRPLESPLIEWIPVMTEELVAMLSAEHTLAKTEGNIRLADLKDERFIVSNANPDLSGMFITHCSEAGFYPNIYFEGEQPDLIRRLVSNNYGVSLVSLSRIDYMNEVQSGLLLDSDIVLKHIDAPRCIRTTGIARMRNVPMTKASSMLMEYLMAEMPRHSEL